jgi:ribosome-associated protein
MSIIEGGSLFFVWRRITHIRLFFPTALRRREPAPLAAWQPRLANREQHSLSMIIGGHGKKVGSMNESSEIDETGGSNSLQLRGDHITLAQAVKLVGLADTGGHAKVIIRNGDVAVNDVIETRPGRKLHAGDRFGTPGGREWTIVE